MAQPLVYSICASEVNNDLNFSVFGCTNIGASCYQAFAHNVPMNERLKWHDARDACKALGAELAVFETRAEWDAAIGRFML